ncbi:MAG: hypothetical protein ACOYNS_06865 [Bacteroidota bacterium]
MLHMVLYLLHVIGMAMIVSISLYLSVKKDIAKESLKKLSTYLMAAAHTQLLTGFSLFFLLISEVNHMKIGIKMLLAIVVAVVATIYRKKIAADESPKPSLLLILLATSIVITIVAFAL